jgi:hypothetical protein
MDCGVDALHAKGGQHAVLARHRYDVGSDAHGQKVEMGIERRPYPARL